MGEEAAVERRERSREPERLDQHRHAARRAAAGDREEDPGLAQLRDGGDCSVGEHLVRGDERAVDVSEKQSDRWGSHGASWLFR